MKKLIIFILAIFIPLAFSSCSDEEEVNEQKPELTGINCYNDNGEEIEEITYTIGQEESIYDSIIVFALYTDGSTENVTKFSTFDQIDTTVVGIKKVDVKYKGFIDSFTVNIIVNEVTTKRIEIDASKVKKIYVVDDRLDLTNLIVKEVLDNGQTNIVDDFNYRVADEYGNLAGEVFKRTGAYQIEISYKNKYDYYMVYVYANDYEQTIEFDYAESELGNDGTYQFSNGEKITEHSDFYISASGSPILNTKNEVGQDISYSFFEEEFNSTLKIDNESGLILTSSQQFKMMLIIEGNPNSLAITDPNQYNITYYADTIEGKTIVCLDGDAGIYTIGSITSLNIIGIFIKINESYIIQELLIDTSNVKTVFNKNDDFTYEGLLVSARIGTDYYLDIDLSDCKIELLINDNVVTKFDINGIYEVRITYIANNGEEFITKYEILVENNYTYYVSIELDLTNVKMEFAKEDSFTYDDLIVYGITNKGDRHQLSSDMYEVILYFSNDKVEVQVNDFGLSYGHYYVLVNYKGNVSDENLKKIYAITYDLGIKEYEQKVVPNVEFISSNNIQVTIENLLTTIVDIKIEFYLDGDLIMGINTLNPQLSNLIVGKTYTITGYYTGYKDNVEYIVFIQDFEISI